MRLCHFLEWDKGLEKLISMVWPYKWLPLSECKDELATKELICVDDLNWLHNREFYCLAHNLVAEFVNNYLLEDVLPLIDRPDERFGGFYSLPF